MGEQNTRLYKIVSLVEKNQRVIDIGTDHSYVPIKLISEKITNVADGSEINDKPLQNALKNIENKNLNSKINIFKSDGLNDIKIENYDTIIIAGMGGKKISEIINGKKITQNLILNPTNNSFWLRKTLQKNGYKIIYEEIVFENKIHNLIIKAKKQTKRISRTKQIIGPYLMKDNSNFTHNYYLEQVNYYKKIYEQGNKKEHKKMYKAFAKGLKWKEKNL